jgi:hypothetical protein
MSRHSTPHAAHHFVHTAPGGLAWAEYDAVSSEVREQLDALDDAVFAALGGAEGTLEHARQLWSEAIASLPREQVDESREQYLRYAAEVMRRFEVSEIRNPVAAIAALEVIEMLASSA